MTDMHACGDGRAPSNDAGPGIQHVHALLHLDELQVRERLDHIVCTDGGALAELLDGYGARMLLQHLQSHTPMPHRQHDRPEFPPSHMIKHAVQVCTDHGRPGHLVMTTG